MSKPDLEKMVDEASVKVMLSYDYCHFEVVLGIENSSLEEVNELGKDAQMIADERVRQYKKAKERASVLTQFFPEDTERKVRAIRENFPESEWSDQQKATVKAWEDYQWERDHPYNYDDDWDEDREVEL
jgi:hypothetical protein